VGSDKEVSSITLSELIDGQKVGGWIILLVLIGAMVLITDGFDIATIGYIGPELVKHWALRREQLTPVLTAGTVGLLFGAPLLSFVGDRFGRKSAIMTGLLFFGLVSFATAAATSLNQIAILRFLTGVGLGGVIPNVVALISEFVPRRLRGRCLVLVTAGVAIGIGLCGRVASAFVPEYGWQILVIVGGVVPIALLVLVYFLVPESIKFLAEKGDQDREVRRLAAVLRPDLKLGIDTRLVVPSLTVPSSRGSPKRLFENGLFWVTPLLWIVQATNQVANFFSITWLPTLLQATGSSTQQAGNIGAMFSVGGLVGGVCLMLVIDRFGIVPLVVLFVLGAPLVAGMTLSGLSPSEHMLLIASAGFCVVGLQFGITAMQGVIYPTPIRSTGAGWCQAAGRIGAIVAPVGGGALVAAHVPIEQMSYGPAILMVIGAVASITLTILCFRRFGSYRVNEFHTSLEDARRVASPSDVAQAPASPRAVESR
jgi:AAHS family 4-hydroxybenzoate transporter-like MFS transporter